MAGGEAGGGEAAEAVELGDKGEVLKAVDKPLQQAEGPVVRGEEREEPHVGGRESRRPRRLPRRVGA